MKVKDIMRTDVTTIQIGATYEQVAKLLFEKKLTGVPVVDKDNHLAGFVSEKDLFRILFPYYKSYYKHPESYTDFESRESKMSEIKYHPVETFMHQDVVTVSPDMPILSAGAVMLANKVHKLPVMENEQIVGVVCREDIYKNIIKKNFFN